MEHLRNEVMVGSRKFYVSTNDTFYSGLETMVFEVKNGQVDWTYLHAKLHRTEEEAIVHHEEVCSNVLNYIQ